MSGPLHVIRYGLIKCEIYLKSTRVGDRFNVVVSRLYRNGDQWHESKQFGRDDLPLLAKVVDHAHTWMLTDYRAQRIEQEDSE